MRTGHTPSRTEPTYWVDCDIPWFTLADVWQIRDGRQKYLAETASKISAFGLANSAAELLPPGTVVLSRTASVGFSGIMPTSMATSQDFWNWVCGPRLLPDYLLHTLRAMQPDLRRMMRGSTHQTIYKDVAASIQIPVPPIDEQRQIADYLDRETARIDALIGKQEQLIETLRERRVSAIANAVTHGLIAAVPTRDSGLPGSGAVPEHWAILPLKRAVSYQEGPGILAVDFRDEGVPLLRVSCVRTAQTTLDGCNFLDPEMVAARWRHFRVAVGDLLISASATMGTVSEVTSEAAGAIPYTGIIRIVPGLMTSDFIKWYFTSTAFLDQVDRLKAGSTIQHFGPTHLDQMGVALPPSDEQHAIARELREQTSKIDALIGKTQQFIETVKERRAALITAAVTGQIDVRSKFAAVDVLAWEGVS
ncbi:MAG: restriction endonuclease subunit S [Jatrophihabitans sp.]|uniref:restriction endonuclease subunit S n=1 Tax=Jatrophihabitans sp. TaxID=1932789 RepID=UPI003F7E65CF